MNLSTCGELADYLATQPRDRKIVMSSDAEGNSYSLLADAGEAMYMADSTWSGKVKSTPAPEDAIRVVVLGPAN